MRVCNCSAVGCSAGQQQLGAAAGSVPAGAPSEEEEAAEAQPTASEMQSAQLRLAVPATDATWA
jgi:hypothetical protein